MDDLIKKVAQILKNSKKIVALTGAGVSAESGIPTFRGKDGLWRNYRAEELATPEAFMRNPQLVWDWYNWRREIIRKAKPNPAHYTLSEFEKIFPDFYLITQNVDGLHERAGSKHLYEVHGDIFRNRCFRCGKLYGDIQQKEVPRCDCGGLIRPDVVWFGEAVRYIDESFTLARECDCLMSIGTSAVVYPIAHLPFVAKDSGAKVIEINLEPTPVSQIADVSIYGKAGEILPKILIEVKNQEASEQNKE